jgi:exosortase/archaeosortase family protein
MVFQSQIVAVDAFIVQHTLWLTGDAAPRVANRVTSESGFAIAVVGGCSAFNNITLLILAMVAGIMWVRPRFQRRDLWWFAMGVALVLMLNTIRLGLMAQSYDSYVYWHNGAGAQYISIMQTVLVLAVAFVAAQGGGARKPPSEAAA